MRLLWYRKSTLPSLYLLDVHLVWLIGWGAGWLLKLSLDRWPLRKVLMFVVISTGLNRHRYVIVKLRDLVINFLVFLDDHRYFPSFLLCVLRVPNLGQSLQRALHKLLRTFPPHFWVHLFKKDLILLARMSLLVITLLVKLCHFAVLQCFLEVTLCLLNLVGDSVDVTAPIDVVD